VAEANQLVLSTLERLESKADRAGEAAVTTSLAVVRVEGRVTAEETLTAGLEARITALEDANRAEVSQIIHTPQNSGGIDKKTATASAGMAAAIIAVVELLKMLTAGG